MTSNNSQEFIPITHINGLPIIGGFICLVILLMLGMAPKKYELMLDYPTDGGCCDEMHYEPMVNRIEVLDDGEIRWNGKKSSLADIREYLQQTKTMNPEPELHFAPVPNANHETVIETVTMIKKSGITKLGWVSNEQYREFGKAKRPLR